MAASTVSLALLEGMVARKFRIVPGLHGKFVDTLACVLPTCLRWIIGPAMKKFP